MNSSSVEITPGSTVTLHFSLATTEGVEALSTFDDEPETLVIGDGTLSEGLELALYGLKAGDRQRLTLTPEQAFGTRNEERVHPIPRSAFSSEIDLEPDLVIGFELKESEQSLAGTVLEIGEEEVLVDFNHPMAGMAVVFDVEILDVSGPEHPPHTLS